MNSKTWVPGPGEVLVGRLEDVHLDVPTQHGSCDIAFIRAEDSRKLHVVFLSRAVLRSEWDAAAPDIGDRVRILYVGTRISQEGRMYHAYRVTVQRAAGAALPATAATYRQDQDARHDNEPEIEGRE